MPRLAWAEIYSPDIVNTVHARFQIEARCGRDVEFATIRISSVPGYPPAKDCKVVGGALNSESHILLNLDFHAQSVWKKNEMRLVSSCTLGEFVEDAVVNL